MRLILLYGEDQELLRSRAKILEMAGYLVRSSQKIQDAEELLRAQIVDLLVICHTVHTAARDRLLDSLAASSPRTNALTISAGHRTHQHPLHANVDTSEGPGALVSAVRHLCQSDD